MSDIERLPAEIEALALKELEKRVTAQIKLTKTEFGHDYPDGRKETFRSPVDGVKLGLVWRTDPDPYWTVTDRAALIEHLEEFPGNVTARLEIAPDADWAEVLAVLDEHASHLLIEVTEVPESVIEAALEQSKATGKPAAPGITQVKPGGALVVKPDPKTAGQAIEGLVNSGLLTWDGRRALPAPDETRRAS